MKHTQIDIILGGSIYTEVVVVNKRPRVLIESTLGHTIKTHSSYEDALVEINKPSFDDWLGEFD